MWVICKKRANCGVEAIKKPPLRGGFSILLSINNYPRKAIRMPAATAEPITPDTLLDIQ